MTNQRPSDKPELTGSTGVQNASAPILATEDRLALDIRTQQAFEQIAGDAAVTGELTDEAAKTLLVWAQEETQRLVATTLDLEEGAAQIALAPKLRYLRRYLRTAARRCANEANPIDALRTYLYPPNYPEP